MVATVLMSLSLMISLKPKFKSLDGEWISNTIGASGHDIYLIYPNHRFVSFDCETNEVTRGNYIVKADSIFFQHKESEFEHQESDTEYLVAFKVRADTLHYAGIKYGRGFNSQGLENNSKDPFWFIRKEPSLKLDEAGKNGYLRAKSRKLKYFKIRRAVQ